MPKYAANPEPIQAIKTLPDLIAYLRDELGWPISPDGVTDDLTFDWSADELRLASGQAVTLQGGAFRQLRPFVPGQPWGSYLLALLNSLLLRWFFPQVSAPFRGGFRSTNKRVSRASAHPPDRVRRGLGAGGARRAGRPG